ncbi:hypothetical protein chiPu_0030624, partial [Chiloscyllium punctatum]|nr:hypothetical protein [Chiloscyllium punctatum]
RVPRPTYPLGTPGLGCVEARGSEGVRERVPQPTYPLEAPGLAVSRRGGVRERVPRPTYPLGTPGLGCIEARGSEGVRERVPRPTYPLEAPGLGCIKARGSEGVRERVPRPTYPLEAPGLGCIEAGLQLGEVVVEVEQLVVLLLKKLTQTLLPPLEVLVSVVDDPQEGVPSRHQSVVAAGDIV